MAKINYRSIRIINIDLFVNFFGLTGAITILIDFLYNKMNSTTLLCRRDKPSWMQIQRHESRSNVMNRHPTSPINIQRHQSTSNVTNRHPTSPIDIQRHQSTFNVTNRHPTAPVDIQRHEATSMSIGAVGCRLVTLDADW